MTLGLTGAVGRAGGLPVVLEVVEFWQLIPATKATSKKAAEKSLAILKRFINQLATETDQRMILGCTESFFLYNLMGRGSWLSFYDNSEIYSWN